MWHYLQTLNLFRSSDTADDLYELQNERIATRIYLLVLVVSLAIVTIYTAQLKITHTLDDQSVTFNQYLSLSQHFSQTLHCSCQHVAISYRSFLTIQPTFHQVCTSDFIGQDWIDYLKSAENTFIEDFTYIGTLIFHLLAAFCQSTEENVARAIDKFLANQLISKELLQQDRFEQQMRSAMENFRLSTELSYSQLIMSLANVTKINQIMSSLMGDTFFTVIPGTNTIGYVARAYNNGSCTCDINRSCAEPLTLYYRQVSGNLSVNDFIVPGFYRSCQVNEAARRSSLECFYDISCLNTIQTYLRAPRPLNQSFQPLNVSAHQRFHPLSTIDEILRSLMIEQWTNSTSYRQYFDDCQIESCIYTYTSRMNMAYMISTLIGLVGGLIKVLRLLIPRLVKWIRRKIVPPSVLPPPNRLTIRSLYRKMCELNFVLKRSPATTPTELRQAILATRLFLILLISSLIILLIYYSAVCVDVQYQVASPSYEKYLDLEDWQGRNPSFSCPCSSMAVSYETFFEVDYRFHPLCEDISIMGPIFNLDGKDFPSHDFRYMFRVYLLSFSQLCRLAAHSIETRISVFNALAYITDQMISSKMFADRTQAIIEELLPSFRRFFSHPVFFMANFTRINEIMNTKAAGFVPYASGSNGNYRIGTTPIQYRTVENNVTRFCDCFVYGQCFASIPIYQIPVRDTRMMVAPGLYHSCSMMEGLLVSSWACFYDQSCLDSITSFLNISRLSTLKRNQLNRSTPQSTNRELVNNMFVEDWDIQASHRHFFDQCRPDHCSYILSENNSLIVIITTVFGLIGGLIKILQIICLPFVKAVFSLHARCKRPRNKEQTPRNHFSIMRWINRLRSLNLFKSNDLLLDTEEDRRNQIIATRIFIVLFLIITITLTLYASQKSVTHEVIISHPSIEAYLTLYEQHSQTLSCPCNQVMIHRETFLTVQPRFHQVCASSFSDLRWMYGIALSFVKLYLQLYPQASNLDLVGIPANDFRSIAPPFFRGLITLCNISNIILQDQRQAFKESFFPTTVILSQEVLEKQGQALIDLLYSTSQYEFNNLIQLNQDWSYSGNFITALQPAVTWKIIHLNLTRSYSRFSYVLFNQSDTICQCFKNRYCSEQVTFYNSSSNITQRYPNPALYYGCSILDALLQSNLAFLYDQNWIDEIRQLIEFDWLNRLNLTTLALDVSLPSQYFPNTTLSVIVKNMMTERWYTHVNYTAYYEQCEPVECRYTYEVKYDAIYIITTVIGLIGGVVTILQLVIPGLVRLFRKYCWSRIRRRNRGRQNSIDVM